MVRSLIMTYKKILLSLGLFQLNCTTESSVQMIENTTTKTTISQPTLVNIIATKPFLFKIIGAFTSSIIPLSALLIVQFMKETLTLYTSNKTGFFASFVFPLAKEHVTDSNVKKDVSELVKPIFLPALMLLVLGIVLVMTFKKINKDIINLLTLASKFIPLACAILFAGLVMSSNQGNGDFNIGALVALWFSFGFSIINLAVSIVEFIGEPIAEEVETTPTENQEAE